VFVRIGQLAEKSGVPASTIRFYEKSGLLPKAARQPSGYRFYDQTALERLQLIRFSQSLGFTLDELPKLLHMPAGFDHDLIMKKLTEKQAEIDALLAQLTRKKTKMAVMIERIDAHWAQGECMPTDELADLLTDFDQ
jgi:MerR family copper efflux transcriptional regulator